MSYLTNRGWLHQGEKERLDEVWSLLERKVGWKPDDTEITLLDWQVQYVQHQLGLVKIPLGPVCLCDIGRAGGKSVARYTLWRYDCILNGREVETRK